METLDVCVATGMLVGADTSQNKDFTSFYIEPEIRYFSFVPCHYVFAIVFQVMCSALVYLVITVSFITELASIKENWILSFISFLR